LVFVLVGGGRVLLTLLVIGRPVSVGGNDGNGATDGATIVLTARTGDDGTTGVVVVELEVDDGVTPVSGRWRLPDDSSL
jgi:hypothetical protein